MLPYQHNLPILLLFLMDSYDIHLYLAIDYYLNMNLELYLLVLDLGLDLVLDLVLALQQKVPKHSN